MWRVVVCDQETSKNEEAKARYRAVKIKPQWVVTAGQQTNKKHNFNLAFFDCCSKLLIFFLTSMLRVISNSTATAAVT
jgi:hypothetical protein